MKCPICLFQDTKVVDSRVAVDGFSIRRRRECLKCGFRFSTYEEIELLDLVIVKKDGRKEAYDKEKMLRGLKRSLEKRTITDDEFKKLVSAIEMDLQALRKSEVDSREIGKIIMKELKKVDKVAFIRFASVYESFEDLEDFQEELNKLLKNKKN
ncbi:MAG: Ribonucleotide reductase regulator NrdR-like protein [Candidatus Falkowbacteria bacterium GW2011_GWC2_38_22]|uniref:Transcriptional repressor NrdR n=1 Tax=Candidatus Falkowbacteria bacterium GW2011_GWE1_38_31 TaxID=1618638 RepID=A0A0G0M8B1_9BACT|nr:MAG: Ribonucleotide reductase regulator NrdR-like protein [Candidatus Falkowbacteria bacterium GW2011_GWF2_38_1205]KKQ61297.1 MAG: Ribonucleotide reductase regulator NrdR-like protein [Candidatus Falkowbacteria bacterium GW2011_GWC2_38_22]KKQ63131.1 MAG: Ribonucleotide reductase regulator NrdR-like protein [Candidatus Falkowbacteria bacterium GW2011_GWF1_38_22]KKQ65328.1 MAG: Ribonucleotide reductase regulator NrdR-like protein [Candidatus Falkowbacteria bacterium GW2011_GWE2_38_254]KKQ69904